jgi:hypothetical protein
MGFTSWLSSFLCGVKDSEIASLKFQVAQLGVEKTRLLERIQDADACLEECSFQLFEADKQVAILESQVESLNKWLLEAIQIPDIAAFINPDSMGSVDPYTLPKLSEYYLTVADTEYHTFTKETWQLVLDLVHKEVKEAIKTWKSEIGDCDNFSTTTQDVASLAFIHAKLLRQGAIMIAWSTTHAYNVFLDSDNVAWVYEPQTNETVGKLGETVDPYGTRLLWIPT